MTYDPPSGTIEPDSPIGRLDAEVRQTMRELGIELIKAPPRTVPITFTRYEPEQAETPGMGDARQAAVDALIEAGFVDPDDGTVPRWYKGESVPVWTVPARVVDYVLAAALPILHPEPTFTASELKERLETATAVALALGRKEMLVEIAASLRPALYASDDGTEFEHTHPKHEGEPECPACWVQDIRQALREVPLQRHHTVSNGLIADPASPSTPEESVPAESAFPDLPEGSDQ